MSSKNLSPPNEIEVIKDYIKRVYKNRCYVKLQRGALIVSVPNAALAATIQLERQRLIASCNLKDKKLVIRNGK